MVASSNIPLLTFILALIAVSCNRVPPSDFYESEGIISITAAELAVHEGWIGVDLPATFSLKSVDLPGESGALTFTFYVQSPGIYRLWLMASHSSGSDAESVNLWLFDDESFLIENYRLQLPEGEIPRWQAVDRGGNALEAQLTRAGYYRVVLETGGLAGAIVHKLHLTMNNLREPEGMGFPDTRHHSSDPVLEKREQTVRIPPAWAFGLLSDYTGGLAAGLVPDGCISSADNCTSYRGREFNIIRGTRTPAELEEAFTSAMAGNSLRGFHLLELPVLNDPVFKKFPALWFGADLTPEANRLQKQLNYLGDPSLPLYEVPYLAFLPQFEHPGIDVIDTEELLRRIQLQAFGNIMYLPMDELNRVLADHPAREQMFDHILEYTELRRRLFPYIYSYTLRSRTTREKMITGQRGYPGQYLFGEAFLVAPVYEPGVASRPVRFPEGTWYDYRTNESIDGGQSWIVEELDGHMPLFVKAGSIIPYRTEAAEIEKGSNRELILDIYTGDAGTFRLYEDDGISTDYRRGEFSTVAFRWFEHDDYATFNIGALVRGFEGQTDTRKYKLRFLFTERPVSVTANGDSVEEGRGEGRWHYSDDENALVINWEPEQWRRTEFVIRFR
jgi:hypothetical protein